MTFAALTPYLLVAAGYLVRHFDLLGKAASLISGPNPASSASSAITPKTAAATPAVSLGNHPVLSDAVNAAIKQAVSDAVSGLLQSVKTEIQNAASAAVSAAVTDLKGKS